MADLHKLALRELVSGVHDRRFSAADVIRDYARRIDAREPDVQAWQHLDLGRALDRAEAMGSAGGAPLAGVPLAIKDIIDVGGMPTRYGSHIYEQAAPAGESAECVLALERAGAIVLGKSVTTEFAYYTPGKTRNPWDPRHTPGGSSMGSAASVAAGMAAGALGTQTNGSVIRPAAFCGVVGFKPTYGLVSNHGTLDPWPSLDHTGVFARRVADAAALAAVICAPGAVLSAVVTPSHPPKLACVRSPVWRFADASQKEIVESAAHKLGHAGAKVEHAELPPEFDDAHRVHRVIMGFEGARHFRGLQAQHRERMSERFNALLDEGAAIPDNEYRDALAQAGRLREAYARWIAAWDAIITPPATGEAPATLQETGNPVFCTIWTLLGAPAITVPIARGPQGLPLGLQLVGARGQDDAVLGAAAWCEAHLPFK